MLVQGNDVTTVSGGTTHVPSSLKYRVVVEPPGLGTSPATVLVKVL